MSVYRTIGPLVFNECAIYLSKTMTLIGLFVPFFLHNAEIEFLVIKIYTVN